jgi:hypothetical protein
MARAHSIHIVTVAGDPVAAFTVKHELQTYLQRHHKKAGKGLRIIRIHDGEHWKPELEHLPLDVTHKFYGLA